VRVLTTTPFEGVASFWGSLRHEDGVLVDRFYPANLYHLTDFRAHGTAARTLWQLLDIWNPHVAARMHWLVQTWRPDLVHTHHLAGLSAAPVVTAARSGVPVVATLHDHALFCVYGTLRRPNGRPCPTPCRRCAGLARSKRWLTRAVHSVVGPSAYILAEHRHRDFFPDASWHVVPNGVGHSASLSARVRLRPHAPFHVAFIGQLADYKGVPVLLDAMRLQPDRDLRLSLAGGGPLLDACKRAAEADSRIRVHGVIGAQERDALLREADLLVLPSTCPECLPTVIAEAQGAGLPVIATRLGGMIEMVQDGRNGLLVEPGDAKLLANAITQFKHDLELWARCAQGALRSAQRYDLDAWVDKIKAIYCEACSRPGARG
jgi:glycosyltransferase involved in cell wall biosynthesis